MRTGLADGKGVASKDILLIGEIAETTGCDPSAIRFYEAQGLLAPRRMGRLRVYRHSDVNRLRVIRDLRSMGFSVEQIRELAAGSRMADLSDLHYSPGFRNRAENQIDKLAGKREEIERQIELVNSVLASSQGRATT